MLTIGVSDNAVEQSSKAQPVSVPAPIALGWLLVSLAGALFCGRKIGRFPESDRQIGDSPALARIQAFRHFYLRDDVKSAFGSAPQMWHSFAGYPKHVARLSARRDIQS